MNDPKLAAKLDVLTRLAERAKEQKGTTAGAYLACLCGMWTHAFRVQTNAIVEKDGADLFGWYTTGIRASSQALGMGSMPKENEKKKKK